MISLFIYEHQSPKRDHVSKSQMEKKIEKTLAPLSCSLHMNAHACIDTHTHTHTHAYKHARMHACTTPLTGMTPELHLLCSHKLAHYPSLTILLGLYHQLLTLHPTLRVGEQ